MCVCMCVKNNCKIGIFLPEICSNGSENNGASTVFAVIQAPEKN